LKLFLTGDPGCGKTTVVRRVVERLVPKVAMTGFWTEELREGASRTGFRGVTLDGRDFLLAHVREKGVAKVGPYGVVLEGLERVGLETLRPSAATRLVVLDEVGKMESFSAAFRETVEALLASSVPVLGTVAVHGVGFPKRVRQDRRIELVRMTRASRDAMVGDVLRRLAAAGIA
jgi:nucleoside-triphosphatase